MKTKWTPPRVRALKGQRFATVTAVDCATGRLADESGFPLILVGDSLGMTVLGHASTLPVTMEDMLHHTAAVARGVQHALVVADMPFLSYHISAGQAVENAGRFIQEARADGVKIEGGAERADVIRAIVDAGIPVLAHIGLLPQKVLAMGGYKVQGRTEEQAERLLDDARAVEAAGAFAVVLEAMPPRLAEDITAAVSIPTIGIGAGPGCDGQILVLHDMLGFTERAPKFVKRYADLRKAALEGLAAYRQDVEQGRFPGPEHTY